jgi:hypothetical protein
MNKGRLGSCADTTRRPTTACLAYAQGLCCDGVVAELIGEGAVANFTWTNAAGGDWSTASNWNPAGPPGNGDNIVLPTLAGAYTSIDDIPVIDGINLSLGNSVTFIVAEGDTGVEDINAFGTNSLFETQGAAIVSIGNGLGGTYAVNGPTAILDITGFNGVGTFDIFSGTASFGNNANLSGGNSFNFEGDSSGNLDILSANNFQNGWSFPVTNFALHDTISFGTTILAAGTYTNVYDAAAHTLTIPKAAGGDYVFNNFSIAAGAPTTFQVTDTSTTSTIEAVCFFAGTMIACPNGERAVETLSVGDRVLTSDGRVMPVRWIGRNTVSTKFADPLRVLPIRIMAGALADHLPVRDLLVSPEHAVLVDDTLIQAGALVNGLSIVRESNVAETFVYYHIELAEHALVLAEGTPAESFVDNIHRMAFDNWEEHEALYGDAPIVEMDNPRARSHRQVPMEIRARLLDRAVTMPALQKEIAA